MALLRGVLDELEERRQGQPRANLLNLDAEHVARVEGQQLGVHVAGAEEPGHLAQQEVAVPVPEFTRILIALTGKA
jgi:hypothetical protein